MPMSTEDENFTHSEHSLFNNVSQHSPHWTVTAMSTDSVAGDCSDSVYRAKSMEKCAFWSDQYISGSMRADLTGIVPDYGLRSESAAQHLGVESELLNSPWIMNQLRNNIMVPAEPARKFTGAVESVRDSVQPSIILPKQGSSGCMEEVRSTGPDFVMDLESIVTHCRSEVVTEVQRDIPGNSWIMSQAPSEVITPVLLQQFRFDPRDYITTIFSEALQESFPVGQMTSKHVSSSESTGDSGMIISQPEKPPTSQRLIQKRSQQPLHNVLQNPGSYPTNFSEHVQVESLPAGRVSGPKHASASQMILDSGVVSQPVTPLIPDVLGQQRRPDLLQDFLFNPVDYSTTMFSNHIPTDSFLAGPKSDPKHASISQVILDNDKISQPETPSVSQNLTQRRKPDPLQEFLYKPVDYSMRFSDQESFLGGQVSCPVRAFTSRNTFEYDVVNKPETPIFQGLSQKRRQNQEAYDKKRCKTKKRLAKIKDRLSVLRELVPGGANLQRIQMWDVAIEYVKFLQLQVGLLAQQEHEMSSSPMLQTAVAGTPFLSEPFLHELFNQELCIGTSPSPSSSAITKLCFPTMIS